MQGTIDIHWFVGVTFRKELWIKDKLNQMQIECFVPTKEVVREKDGKKVKGQQLLTPGYVFVHTDLHTAKSLPGTVGMEMRFLKNYSDSTPVIVPDRQMRDFMFLVTFSEQVIPLIPHKLKQGDRVRVIKGELKGLEGELIRIKGHKRVVVRISDMLAVATTYIPASYLEKTV